MSIVAPTAGGNDGVRAVNLDGDTRDAKTSVLLRARLFVFSILFSICKDVEPSWAIVLASKVVEFLQLVSFPMDEASAYPWNAGTTSWLSSISLAFRLCTLITLSHEHVLLECASAYCISAQFDSSSLSLFCLAAVFRAPCCTDCMSSCTQILCGPRARPPRCRFG
jgi:hypothetical protein